MWIPRFAYNENGEDIKYIKDIEEAEVNWTIPELFAYRQASETAPDFLLTGAWVAVNTDDNINSTIAEMNQEESIYGFIANTIAVTNNQTNQNEIQKYIEKMIVGVGVPDNTFADVTNPNRIILKIINQNNQDPMKVIYNVDLNTIEVSIRVSYSKNKIVKIEDYNGNILSENSTEAIDTEIPKNGIYYYVITDELGNSKTIRVDINVTRTIVYNINGGTKAVSNITAGYGEEITMPVPERKYVVSYNTNGNGSIASTTVEYIFNGWYTQTSDGEKKEYTTMPKNNQTLYAQWTEVPIILPDFPNEHYLGSWYSNSARTVAVGRVGEEYYPKSNITLYAGYRNSIYAFVYYESSSNYTLVFNTVNTGLEGKTPTNSYGDISSKHYTSKAPWQNSDIKKVVFLDVICPKYTSYWFDTLTSIKTIDASYIRTNNVTDMSCMFYNCRSLTELDLSSWNVSKVTDMQQMFGICEDLTELDLSSWNVSNVTNMYRMFIDCNNLTSLNLKSWNVRSLTNMQGMFSDCHRLINLDVSGWNTANVTNMTGVFSGCWALTELDLSSWSTRKVTSMNAMFSNCKKLTRIYVGTNWVTTNATTNGMFNSCGTQSVTTK